MSITIPIKDSDKDAASPATRKGWVGTAWGLLTGGIIATFLGVASIPIALGMVVIGSLGGYFIGNNSGENVAKREAETGKKEVQEPRFWNWNLAKGYVLGEVPAICVNLLMHATGTHSAGKMALLSLLPIGGLIYGGITGKQKMQDEYNHAREIEKQNDISAAAEKVHSLQPQQEKSSPATQVQPHQENSQAKEAKFTKQEDMRRTANTQPQSAIG